MENTLEIIVKDKYIVQKITGEMNRYLAIEYNRIAHQKGAELGIGSYLMDLRGVRNTDSILNNYQFAYKDMRQVAGLNRGARTALLIDVGDTSHDFIVTASKNSGLSIDSFTNEEEALRYLLADRSP